VQRTSSQLAESFIDTFCDGLVVTAGCSGANDEVVGERTDLVEVEDYDVLRLLVEGRFEGLSQIVVSCFLANGFYLMNKVCVC
jgi:hypothetical protein